MLTKVRLNIPCSNIFGVLMKKLMSIVVVSCLLSCSPTIGSEQWCQSLKDKAKSDWTSTELKDFTKHCIF